MRLPITPALMKNLRNFWHANCHDCNYAMWWAAACMCFFDFIRAGELVVPSDIGFGPSYHLTFGNVLIDSQTSPSYLVVKLMALTTNPFRQGVQIYHIAQNSGGGILWRIWRIECHSPIFYPAKFIQ